MRKTNRNSQSGSNSLMLLTIDAGREGQGPAGCSPSCASPRLGSVGAKFRGGQQKVWWAEAPGASPALPAVPSASHLSEKRQVIKRADLPHTTPWVFRAAGSLGQDALMLLLGRACCNRAP